MVDAVTISQLRGGGEGTENRSNASSDAETGTVENYIREFVAIVSQLQTGV